ncbi:MAG TPA: FGGY-family carbohydrate kinase [Thermoleophilaceae bacterium]
MDSRRVLALDLGTGGPKVALVGLDGEVLGAEREPNTVTYLPGGGAEQDPADWWRAIVAAARRLLGAHPDERVFAVAITGQWAGTVAVDAAGDPLCPAIIWLDSRGAPAVRRVAGGPVAGYSPLRALRWLRLTGGAPSLSARDALGHILYLKSERPDVYRATAAFLEPVDWLGLKLSGRLAATNCSATLGWVTDTRDLAAPAYDEGLLRTAGIDRAKLPELLPANAVLGPLAPAAAEELGLGGDVQVVAGTPDTMSAAVGSGATADHAAHLYVGTSSWISCHVPYKRTDALHSIAALPSALPDRYLVSCEQQTAGVCAERARDALFPDSGDEGFALLEELAASAPAGSGGVIFTPWLNGERTPVDDHLVRGGLHNLSLDTGRAQVARAVLEGVALNARWMQHHVERFTRKRLEPLAFIGGGAHSELWCQIMADVLDREIHRVADPVYAGVRGAALLAGLALGELERPQLDGRAPVAATYAPRPAARATYDELYAAFRGIYKSNRRLYRRLNGGAE